LFNKLSNLYMKDSI